MNVPNALTTARILMIPIYVYVWFAAIGSTLYGHFLAAAIIFLAASFTDFLDGKIARKTGQITKFGKIADPIADKLLTFSAYFCIYAHIKPRHIAGDKAYIFGLVLVGIIVFREIAVTVMRMFFLKKKGIALSAGLPGKIKTGSQIALLFVSMLFIYSNEKSYSFAVGNTPSITVSINILIFIIVILTVYSGIYCFATANTKKN